MALVIASGVAVAAYWPFPRATAPASPVATILINRTTGPHPLAVSVTANVSGGTPPFQYNWSFGDGGTSSASGTDHIYMTHGAFQVLLRVTDRTGRVAAAGTSVKVDPVKENPAVLDASAQTLGAGLSSAWIVPISIPTTELSTWINGTTNVTACSLGGNCLAYVEVLNVYDETNLTHGQPINNPIWCLDVEETCMAARNVSVTANLTGLPGQTVYLVLFNTDLVWGQTVTAVASMECWY